MTTLRTLLAGLLAALGLVAMTASAAHACSCAMASPRAYVAGADVVFTGTLVQVDPPPRRPVMSSGDPVTYHFDVHEVLKGQVPSNAQVTSAVDGGSCGLERMTVDREYVVYADGDQELSADLCGGTSPVGPGRIDRLERLTGHGHQPAAAASYPSDGGPGAGWVLVGAAGLVAAAAAALAVRRRGLARSEG